MQESFELEITLEGCRVAVVPLGADPVLIGRGEDNHVVLADARVSARHARISTLGSGFTLEDLHSTRGTWLDGMRIAVAALPPGARIGIGPYELRLRPAGPADSAVPESGAAEDPEAPAAELVAFTEIVGIADLRVVLEALLERSASLLGARRALVVLAREGRLSPVMAFRGAAPGVDEVFSRTVCERALAAGTTVLLGGPGGSGAIGEIASLADTSPGMVAGIPLLDRGQVLGVMYMEGPARLSVSLGKQTRMMRQIGAVGGRALAAALERQQIVSESERWRWLATAGDDGPDLTRTSVSPAMMRVLSVVDRVAREDVNVLVLGESGTGKEVVSRRIHQMSPRAGGPFVALNCGAIPHDLIEAELFGYEAGAFTGAQKRRPGRVELAQGGTLLLDEIGEMPRDLQVKLLRVLEQRTFERVGGAETIRLDVRLLAATHRDLAAAVAAGEFREDLLYRLDVVRLSLPPLRSRREDIGPLVTEMLLAANHRFRRKLHGIAPDALEALQAYRWPGNVRELKNVIERAFALEETDRLTLASLPFVGSRHVDPATRPPPVPAEDPQVPLVPLVEFIRGQELAYVQQAYVRCGENMTKTAQVLGLTRAALYKKMWSLGLRERKPDRA